MDDHKFAKPQTRKM